MDQCNERDGHVFARYIGPCQCRQLFKHMNDRISFSQDFWKVVKAGATVLAFRAEVAELKIKATKFREAQENAKCKI